MTDWFAGAVAERYDEDTAHLPVEEIVEFLAPLGGGGALELAIGTGRVAVPLAARGVRVAGIDFSPDMVAQLRAKTTAIPVEIGEMTTTCVEGAFSLVYVVFNSINNLTTQDAQVGVDEYDADTQRLVSHHFMLRDGRWERISMPFRAVSPAELDLMARLAGMRLRERWSGWQREPFTAESTKHVSVWEKP